MVDPVLCHSGPPPSGKKDISPPAGSVLVDSPQWSAMLRTPLADCITQGHDPFLGHRKPSDWSLQGVQKPSPLATTWANSRHHLFRIPLRVGLGFHGDCTVHQCLPVLFCCLLLHKYWFQEHSPVNLRTSSLPQGLLPKENTLLCWSSLGMWTAAAGTPFSNSLGTHPARETCTGFTASKSHQQQKS